MIMLQHWRIFDAGWYFKDCQGQFAEEGGVFQHCVCPITFSYGQLPRAEGRRVSELVGLLIDRPMALPSVCKESW
jgi:hypothetical protein